jgi:hypothetical protein
MPEITVHAPLPPPPPVDAIVPPPLAVPQVYVRVDSRDGRDPQRFWIYDKFMARLYEMREMYQVR